jgi:hypothetical protein
MCGQEKKTKIIFQVFFFQKKKILGERAKKTHTHTQTKQEKDGPEDQQAQDSRG